MPRKPRTRKSGRTTSRSLPRDQRDGLDPSILPLLPKSSGRFRKKDGLPGVWKLTLEEIRRIASQFKTLPPDQRTAFKSIGGTYSGPGVPPEPHPGGDQADSLAVQDPGPSEPVGTGRRALLPAPPFERHVAVFLRLADLAAEQQVRRNGGSKKRLLGRFLMEWGLWSGPQHRKRSREPAPPSRTTIHRHRQEADLDVKQIDALILDAYRNPEKPPKILL